MCKIKEEIEPLLIIRWRMPFAGEGRLRKAKAVAGVLEEKKREIERRKRKERVSLRERKKIQKSAPFSSSHFARGEKKLSTVFFSLRLLLASSSASLPF